jgi:hypothetical protein
MNLYKKVAFLDGVRRAGGVETESGGIKIQRPLSIAEHSTITQLATGYEPVSLAVNDVLRPAIYDWCRLHRSYCNHQERGDREQW